MKKSIINLVLVMVILIGAICTPTVAMAAEYEAPRTYVSIYRDGKYVDVVAWYEEDGVFYLENYTDLNKVFPDETKDTTFVPGERANLGPYAKKYGYSMTLEGVNKLLLTKNGNNPGGGEVTVPRTTLTVYKNGNKVNVSAWAEENGKIYLESYSELKKLFPEETKNVTFPTVVEPVALEKFAKDYGYDLIVVGTYLNVNKKDDGEVTVPRTTLTVYKNGNKVNVSAWAEENGKIYLESYSELKKLFPEETKNVTFPTVVEPVALEKFAKDYGYDLIVVGTYLNVNKKDDGEVTVPRTTLTVYKNGKNSGITAWQYEDGKITLADYTALKKLFPDETSKLVLPPVQSEVELKPFATQFGYTYSVKDKNLYLSKETTNPNPDGRIVVYRGQTKVDVTIWKDSNSGKYYITSFKELYKLFPDETAKLKVPNVEGAVPVAQYAEMFGYTMDLSGNTVTFNQLAPSGNKSIEIWINGEKLVIPDNVPAPYVTAGTTFVPMRAVCERLNAKVEWFRAVPHDLVTVNREGVSTVVKIGSKEYTVNGVQHTLLAAPEYKTLNGNTSTMLPLRAVAESFGASVDWLGRLNRVIIMDEYLF